MEDNTKDKNELLREIMEKIEEDKHPDPEIYCCKTRAQTKGMLGGPKYICTMPKGHKGDCFKVRVWSPYC